MVFFFVLGRVCVPIDPNRCDEFDPTTVPTLSQVNIFCNDNFMTCIQGRGKLSTGSVICVVFVRDVPIYYLESIWNMHNETCSLVQHILMWKREISPFDMAKVGGIKYACIPPLHL